MGTYTANYQLYMPTVGEQGWGDLMNGNLTTIDTTMKGLSNRATALENTDTAFNTRITKLEAGEFDGNISAETFNGDLVVNAVSNVDTGIGLYEVVPSQSSVSVSKSYNAGETYYSTVITDDIIITDVVIAPKKGFKFASTAVKINCVVTSTNYITGSDDISLYVNDVLIQTINTTSGTANVTFTDVEVTKGDVLYVKSYKNINKNNITHTVTITLNNLAGNLYFG